MSGRNAAELASEFGFSRFLNPRVQRAVYHTSLSVPASEKLSDDTWSAIATDYLQGMRFDSNQYILVKHNDTEHNHIHIVASRIRMTDGSCVSDSWDYVRSEKLIRKLEKKYQLSSPEIKQPSKRSPTTGESRLRRRTGESSVREQIQSAIDELSLSQPSMTQLIEQLRQKEIYAYVKITRNGVIQGISYSKDNIGFSGTHLGAAYTFKGLQKYRNISYQKDRDNAALHLLNSLHLKKDWQSEEQQRPNISENIPQFWVQRTSETLNLLLDYIDSEVFCGQTYTTTRKPGKELELTLWRNDNNTEILKTIYERSTGTWKATSSPSLTEEDWKKLQLLETRLRLLNQQHNPPSSTMVSKLEYSPLAVRQNERSGIEL